MNGRWVLVQKEQKGRWNGLDSAALSNRAQKTILVTWEQKTGTPLSDTNKIYTLSTLRLIHLTAPKVEIYSKIIVNCAHQKCLDEETEKLWLVERTYTVSAAVAAAAPMFYAIIISIKKIYCLIWANNIEIRRFHLKVYLALVSYAIYIFMTISNVKCCLNEFIHIAELGRFFAHQNFSTLSFVV